MSVADTPNNFDTVEEILASRAVIRRQRWMMVGIIAGILIFLALIALGWAVGRQQAKRNAAMDTNPQAASIR